MKHYLYCLGILALTSTGLEVFASQGKVIYPKKLSAMPYQ